MDFEKQTAALDGRLRIGASFDVIKRTLTIGGRQAAMYMIDGFVKDDIMEKIMEFLMKADEAAMQELPTAQAFADRFVSYVEVALLDDDEAIETQVLSGTIALTVDGYGEAIMIDARTYPTRGVEEPEADRVLRGSHDGFVETLVFNTAMIRRRIRSRELTMEIHTVGKSSKTDIVIAYMAGRVKEETLARIREKISNLQVNALTMAQESLVEALLKKGWYNPFPKVRYTERPDTAAAGLLEGKVAVIIDNTASVMMLPATIFDFVQECNDFYFPPLIGTYLRFVRMVLFFSTLLLTPVWFLLVQHPEALPPWLGFIKIAEPAGLPLLAQILIFELAIDGLKMASLNTPSALSNSFSVVGALILGDFAVQANWFVPEIILYMGVAAIGNFTQPSFELGYACKLCRVLLVILVAIGGLIGLLAGLGLIALLLATNRTVTGGSYLYPLIPFDGPALRRNLLRVRMNRKNS